MAFKKTFIVSDENVNSNGFWVRTEGIDLTTAQKNCPCFYDHNTWEAPIGHWENLRIENGKLLGDVVIEGADEREKMFIRKIENGDIKGCSIGADVSEWKTEPIFLKSNSACLFASTLFEISITPLPGNSGALALKHKGSMVKLSTFGTNDIVPLIKKEHDMKAIALKLGLPETATENEILAAIGGIQLSKQNAEVLTQKVIDKAGEGLEESQKETYVILSKANPEHALKFAENCKAANVVATAETITPTTVALQKDVKVSDLIQAAKGRNLSTSTQQTYDYLRKHNPVELNRIKKEEPEEHNRLIQEYANGVRHKD